MEATSISRQNHELQAAVPIMNVLLRTCCGLDAALRRKGKGEDVAEQDMEAVVHAHNSKF
jgi:hypothetical protein